MEVSWTSVRVPARVGDRFEVYVNGVRQREGADYTRRGDELLFPRPLAQEGRLGFWRWLSLFLGVAGTYRKHESVDIVYEVNGKRTVETGLPILQSGPMETPNT
jgi:hypothetical protein